MIMFKQIETCEFIKTRVVDIKINKTYTVLSMPQTYHIKIVI